MSLYANINVSKAEAKVHTAKQVPEKSSKSAALYADVRAKPPPQKAASVQHATAPTSAVVDLVEDAADKNPESLGSLSLSSC